MRWVRARSARGGMATRAGRGDILAATHSDRDGRRMHLSVAAKFCLSLSFALLWAAGSAWLARGWAGDIGVYVTPVGGWIVVSLIAIIPGFVVALMGMSLILDRQPPLTVQSPTVAVTIIVAASNEESGIGETLERLAAQDYAGPLRVILADNKCTDETVGIAQSVASDLGLDVVVVHEPEPGKSHALNTALLQVTTLYVITVDADTLLHPEAVRRMMSRMVTDVGNVVAVAGSVLVRNSRTNLLTRMQEWDYWIGIAAIKRMQSMYSATLVAQGAFSVYNTDAVRRIGGWPDAIGEDIVVTWRLMQDGSRVLFEPTAIAFTDAPDKTRHFMIQRSRWARGMFEGLHAVPPWRQKRPLAKAIASIDLLIPLLDAGYALLWLPGIVLFLLGFPILVSAWTLLVLPLTLIMYGTLRHYQSSRVFGPLGLQVRRNRIGYLAFLLGYQALCSTASLVGYAQFLTARTRRWK